MPLRNGKQLSAIPGLYLRSRDALHDAIIELDNVSTAPTTDSAHRYLYVDGSVLKFDNGSSVVSLTGGGAGTVPSWETIYNDDKTLTINSTTLTFALTHATNDGLTLTGSAGSAGQVVQITNSGTGDDIRGTSDTWAVTKAGQGTFTGIDGCDSLVAAASLVLEATGAGTISVGATSTGAIDIGTGGGAITLATATTASLGLTVTAGGILSSDGIVDVVDNSNAASSLRVTNDTQTTYGNASDAGMVVFRSESLTTGALLHLSLDETAQAGGFFLRAWSQDAGASAFTIGELGATVIAGSASGTDALTLTAGDITVTSGDITASEGSVVIVNTANETAFQVTADSVTTGVVMDINADGVTSGTLLHLDTTAATFAGKYIDCYDGAATDFSVGLYGATIIAGNASGTDALTLNAGDATVTSGDVVVSEGSVDITNTADEQALAITSTAISGDAVVVTADSVTDGTLLKLTSSAAGLTTGLYINCFDGAASDFSVGANGATVIAGSATGTDALTITAGDITLTNGDVTLTDGDLILTANGSLITFTGTGANGGVIGNLKNAAASALSGVQLDVEIDIGGVPYYFTVYPTKA